MAICRSINNDARRRLIVSINGGKSGRQQLSDNAAKRRCSFTAAALGGRYNGDDVSGDIASMAGETKSARARKK